MIALAHPAYPGWAKAIIIFLICLPIIPIGYYLLKDLIQHPKVWVDGFKNRFCHRIEYMPDPSDYDINRRYKPENDDNSPTSSDIEMKKEKQKVNDESLVQDDGVQIRLECEMGILFIAIEILYTLIVIVQYFHYREVPYRTKKNNVGKSLEVYPHLDWTVTHSSSIFLKLYQSVCTQLFVRWT